MDDSIETRLRDSLIRLWCDMFAAANMAVCDSETARDIVQDTVVKLLENVDRLQNVDDIEAYIFGVLYNTIADSKRKAKATVPLKATNEKDLAYDVDEAWATETKTMVVNKSLKLLQPREQDVVVMYDLLEMSAAEIASKIDVSESTVRNILREAHRKMKKYIEVELEKEGLYI